jgi:hypothetical protein
MHRIMNAKWGALAVFALSAMGPAVALAQTNGAVPPPPPEEDRELAMQIRNIDRAYGRVPALPCCRQFGDTQTISLATGAATWVAQAPATPGSLAPTQTSVATLSSTELHTNPASAWVTVPASGSNTAPRWIRMNAASEAVNGMYTYTTKFVARRCPGSSGIRISGQLAADDWAVVKVNGVAVAGGNSIGSGWPGFANGWGFGANALTAPINHVIPASSATGVHTVTIEAYNLGAGAAGISTNITASQNCDVRPPPPVAHIPSWEIAGQFNPTQNPFEVWTYGYKQAADCTGPLVPLTNQATQGTPWNTRYWLRGTNINNSSDLPGVGQSQGATLLTPLRFSPNGLSLHPGPQNQCAVVRFTVPQTGSYRMMGRFWAQNVSAPGNETDTDTMVVHTAASNGAISFIDPVTRVQALSGPVTNNHFEITGGGQTFQQGDTIDFMVGSRGNFNSDSTGLHGYIERVTP